MARDGRLDPKLIGGGGAAPDDTLVWDGARWAPGAVPPTVARLVTWTKLLAASPMTSLTGWNARSGTWTPGGTYGVNQTNGALSDCWLEWTTDLSGYEFRAVEATIRLTSGGKAGFGFFQDAAWGPPALSIAMDEGSDTIWWDRYGMGGSTYTYSPLIQNTDYTFRIVERTPTSQYFVFVNGVQITTIGVGSVSPASQAGGRVGLYARSGTGWWRDVTVWGGMGATFDMPT